MDGIKAELAARLTGELDSSNASILVNLLAEGVEAYIRAETLTPLRAMVEREAASGARRELNPDFVARVSSELRIR